MPLLDYARLRVVDRILGVYAFGIAPCRVACFTSPLAIPQSLSSPIESHYIITVFLSLRSAVIDL